MKKILKTKFSYLSNFSAYHPDELNKSETLKIGKKGFHNYDNIFYLFLLFIFLLVHWTAFSKNKE
jgi:hypothetical protein